MTKVQITDKEIQEYVESHGFTVDILTKSELQAVKKEIELIKKHGPCFLDGVLTDPMLFIRQMERDILNRPNEE